VRQVLGGGAGVACAARVDVLDHRGAGGGAVALPKLPAVDAVAGPEDERPARGRQFACVFVGVGEAGAARVDVLDHRGAGGGAVALPKLPAVDAVAGPEEERPAHVRQFACVFVGVGEAGAARVDVLDHRGAGGGAVALPELPFVDAVVGP